jgi:hypothetical protein
MTKAGGRLAGPSRHRIHPQPLARVLARLALVVRDPCSNQHRGSFRRHWKALLALFPAPLWDREMGARGAGPSLTIALFIRELVQALTDPPGSAFKVSENGMRGAMAWPKTGLQEPQPPILAVNFVIEANQDSDELPVCENELPLVIGVAGHDFDVLERKTR